MTSLIDMMRLLPTRDFFCFDISWSRIYLGKKFLTNEHILSQPKIFTADIKNIPLPDSSIDIVTTSHALEPNHGNELELLCELLRVSRYGLVLFEPSYELCSEEQRKRMEYHGYVRGIPQVLMKLPCSLVEYSLLENFLNHLNRTAAFVIHKKDVKPHRNPLFVAPCTKNNLIFSKDNMLWDRDEGVLYPILSDIPLLREELGILATHYEG